MYNEKTKEVLPDQMRLMCLLGMVPTKHEEHLEINSRTIDSYDLVKADIGKDVEQYLARHSGATPVTDGVFEGSCLHVVNKSHRSADC